MDLLNDLKNKIDNISDDEMSKFVDEYIKREEENRWKDIEPFSSFLIFFMNLVNEKKSVMSDEYFYNENKKVYSSEKFDRLSSSLAEAILDYAAKYYIDCINLDNNCFCESSCIFYYNDKYYIVERVFGQGTFYRFTLVENKKDIENLSYVDYNLMMNREIDTNKEKYIYSDLKNILLTYINNPIIKEELKNVNINEYVKKILKVVISELN